MSGFLAMGGYAAYIWPAYAVSALGLGGATVWTVMAWRRAKAKLAALGEAMNRWIYLLPVAGFLVLAGFLFRSLYLTPTEEFLPSVLIDKPAPGIALPALDDGIKAFGRGDLAAGHVTVVNFFASWCAPCHLEAGSLMLLSKTPGIALYGVAYKDKPADTKDFLAEAGNPFAAIVADAHGLTGIDWGVTAPPETFIVDGKGVIRFKYIGALTDEALARQVMPEIEKARAAR